MKQQKCHMPFCFFVVSGSALFRWYPRCWTHCYLQFAIHKEAAWPLYSSKGRYRKKHRPFRNWLTTTNHVTVIQHFLGSKKSSWLELTSNVGLCVVLLVLLKVQRSAHSSLWDVVVVVQVLSHCARVTGCCHIAADFLYSLNRRQDSRQSLCLVVTKSRTLMSIGNQTRFSDRPFCTLVTVMIEPVECEGQKFFLRSEG
jgi:hypothetical protein